MENHTLISITQICDSYSIAPSFLEELEQYGLIEITRQQSMGYLHHEQLPTIEKMIRLHYELDINMEGIEALTHVLQKMRSLQEEMEDMRRRLRRYEDL